MQNGMNWSRRGVMLASGAALALSACGPKAQPAAKAEGATPGPTPGTLEWAIAGDWRSPADRVRDAFRHPLEALTFFGIAPGQTVVELWPGVGWYTDILAPYLTATKGKLVCANFELPNPDDPAAGPVVDAFKKRLAGRSDLFGAVEHTAFGSHTGALCPPGTADRVLFLRNIHNWMAAGIAEKAFRDALAALKPGGILGIEEHRAGPGGAQDALATSGYVQQDYVKQLAKEAGFAFDKASDINANSKDTRNHPFGVWTLPPTRRSSPRGSPPNPLFDHKKYDAVGESDRMTLRFVKPK